MQWHLVGLQAAVVAVVALFFYFMRPGKRGTYLVDFYCLRPPNRCPNMLSGLIAVSLINCSVLMRRDSL